MKSLRFTCAGTGATKRSRFIFRVLQPQQESLDGSMRALTLWQHRSMQAVIAQAQATKCAGDCLDGRCGNK